MFVFFQFTYLIVMTFFVVLLTEMGERCTFKDDDDCSFSFSYKENPGKDIEISVQREKGTRWTLFVDMFKLPL